MSGWVTPTGASGWSSPELVRDDNTGTSAFHDTAGYTWSPFFVFTHASLYCTSVRFFWSDNTSAARTIDVDIYYGGAWHHLYDGDYTESVWQEKSFGGQWLTQFRIRIYVNKDSQQRTYGWEVDFYQITAPTAPSGCTAHYVATNNSKCTWTDNSDNETGFTIQVDINDAGFTPWKNVGANVQDSGTYTTGANKKIRFRVQAYNAAGSSAWSTSGYVYTTPAAPSGCSISFGTINVGWNDNSAYEDGFKIERNLDDAGWALVQTVGANVIFWADTSQPTDANEKYQYRVRAYKGALYSSYSTSNRLFRLVLTENLALKDVSSIPFGPDLVLQEALALKDVSSIPFGPDLVLQEALALKDVSDVPACPDIILGEALALKESLTEISRQLTVEEAIALKESLPVIHRELPPLEDAIAFIESLPVIDRQLPPLEEALALAESFVASEQTIVRKVATAEFLAEQAKRSNQPAKRTWLYINNSLYDVTDKFMSMGPIDRKMTYKPGETKLLTISDQNLVMSNADKYFSDLNPSSPFYDRDYAGADQIKVYAGFIIPSTGYAEVLQKADTKLMAIELMTKEGHAHLRCQDSFREVFDIYVGMPAADGTPNPLTYTSKTFKYIMDDLLINKAGIPSAKVDIENVSLTFSSISFEKKKIVDCIQKLSEVARGNTIELGDGTVQFSRFISEAVDVDLILQSGENYSRLRYVGQDFTLKVNKVVVIGAAGVYAEVTLPSETGVTLKYENDAILTNPVAGDVAIESLGRFAVHPALVEVTGEFLPSLDLKSVVKVYEPHSMMNPKIFQIRELAIDIVGHSTRMLLSTPGAAGESKTWASKADWDSGALVDTYCPISLEQLELAYDKLSGTGEFIFDAGTGKIANWIFFNHTKADEKTIWRDDFRADSRSKYSMHNFPGWNDGAAVQPGYDATGKRLIINTGNDQGTTLEIPGVSIQNTCVYFKVFITGQYPTNSANGIWLRYANSDNNYVVLHQAVDASLNSDLLKWVNNEVITIASGTKFAKNVWRTLVFEINGNNLKTYTDEYTIQATDGSHSAAGKVLVGCWQTIGYIGEIQVAHYTLPSPANTSVTFQFATSDNGTDWSAWTDDIANCADSRYIKVKVSVSRTNFLSSAMPVLEDMTVGYFLKGT